VTRSGRILEAPASLGGVSTRRSAAAGMSGTAAGRASPSSRLRPGRGDSVCDIVWCMEAGPSHVQLLDWYVALGTVVLIETARFMKPMLSR